MGWPAGGIWPIRSPKSRGALQPLLDDLLPARLLLSVATYVLGEGAEPLSTVWAVELNGCAGHLTGALQGQLQPSAP